MKQKPTFSEKEFSMPAWLYQMTAGEINGETWYPEDYRKEVWEGEKIPWPVGEKIYVREQDPMSVGDTIIFFFCKSGDVDPRTGIVDPGIYGWGSITDISYYTTRTGKEKEDEIEFVVKPPSNFLKDKPLWNDDINQLMNEIRRRPLSLHFSN